MGFDSLVRSLVGLADEMTESLQATVQHYMWISTTGTGAPIFAAPIIRKAIVEHKQSAVRTPTGETVLSRAKVTLLGPIEANTAVGREGPVDPRDKLILPDGTSGPIIAVNGLIDPTTLAPYMYEVYLG
jgi:hypothetical protein